MSFYDFMIGYEAGKSDANTSDGGEGWCLIGQIILSLPTLLEAAAAAAAGCYGAYYATESLGFPELVYLALAMTGMFVGLGLYGLIFILFAQTRRLAILGGLVSAVVWIGYFFGGVSELQKMDGDYLFVVLVIFVLIFLSKGRNYGMFERGPNRRYYLGQMVGELIRDSSLGKLAHRWKRHES